MTVDKEVLKEKLSDMEVPGFAPRFTKEEFEAAGLDFEENAIDEDEAEQAASDPLIA